MKTTTHFCGFLLIELMVALVALLLSTTILISWHNLIINKKKDTLRLFQVTSLSASLLEQLKIDRTLQRKQRMQKDSIEFNWHTTSVPLEQINHLIGKPDHQTYFSYITLVAVWKTAQGERKTYTVHGGIYE